MKTLLIAILLTSTISAVLIALAFGNGRYQAASAGANSWVIIDTKTGHTRICSPDRLSYKGPKCSPWSEPDE